MGTLQLVCLLSSDFLLFKTCIRRPDSFNTKNPFAGDGCRNGASLIDRSEFYFATFVVSLVRSGSSTLFGFSRICISICVSGRIPTAFTPDSSRLIPTEEDEKIIDARSRTSARKTEPEIGCTTDMQIKFTRLLEPWREPEFTNDTVAADVLREPQGSAGVESRLLT
jgi:hypothetical protein